MVHVHALAEEAFKFRKGSMAEVSVCCFRLPREEHLEQRFCERSTDVSYLFHVKKTA